MRWFTSRSNCNFKKRKRVGLGQAPGTDSLASASCLYFSLWWAAGLEVRKILLHTFRNSAFIFSRFAACPTTLSPGKTLGSCVTAGVLSDFL